MSGLYVLPEKDCKKIIDDMKGLEFGKESKNKWFENCKYNNKYVHRFHLKTWLRSRYIKWKVKLKKVLKRK